MTETSASIGGTDINITVSAQRSLRIEAVVISGSGQENYVQFQQDLNYTNTQYYLNNVSVQVSERRWVFVRRPLNPRSVQNVVQVSSGSVLSLHNYVPTVVDNFEYPLYINITALEVTNTSETSTALPFLDTYANVLISVDSLHHV